MFEILLFSLSLSSLVVVFIFFILFFSIENLKVFLNIHKLIDHEEIEIDNFKEKIKVKNNITYFIILSSIPFLSIIYIDTPIYYTTVILISTIILVYMSLNRGDKLLKITIKNKLDIEKNYDYKKLLIHLEKNNRKKPWIIFILVILVPSITGLTLLFSYKVDKENVMNKEKFITYEYLEDSKSIINKYTSDVKEKEELNKEIKKQQKLCSKKFYCDISEKGRQKFHVDKNINKLKDCLSNENKALKEIKNQVEMKRLSDINIKYIQKTTCDIE